MFDRVRPQGAFVDFIEWYWTSESEDREPSKKKIIPDGFPEVVFHYGDPYRIKLRDRWQPQGQCLLGGQLRKHFYLENTGRSGMFGITFKPAALSHLFGLQMNRYSHRVVSLSSVPGPWNSLIDEIQRCNAARMRIEKTEAFLSPFLKDISGEPVEKCLKILHQNHGTLTMSNLCSEVHITERQLQRLFGRYVGVSPKYYSRILRFNHIFSLIQGGKVAWADVVFLSGYYDQSHFIRDFKIFTGEDPTAYVFQANNLTNFFAQKATERYLSGLSN